MADQINTTTTPETRSSGNGIAFIVGGLVVIVALLAYALFAGGADDSDDVTISIEGAGEAVEGAAEAVEGAAEQATGSN